MIPLEDVKNIRLFQGLDTSFVEALAEISHRREYLPGGIIFRKGHNTPFLHFVLDGTVSLEVEVSDHEAVEVHRIERGELLGWSPMLGRPVMTATARAATGVHLAILESEGVLRLCEREPRFGAAFYRQLADVLASRLDDTRWRLSRFLNRRPIPPAPNEGSD